MIFVLVDLTASYCQMENTWLIPAYRYVKVPLGTLPDDYPNIILTITEYFWLSHLQCPFIIVLRFESNSDVPMHPVMNAWCGLTIPGIFYYFHVYSENRCIADNFGSSELHGTNGHSDTGPRCH